MLYELLSHPKNKNNGVFYIKKETEQKDITSKKH